MCNARLLHECKKCEGCKNKRTAQLPLYSHSRTWATCHVALYSSACSSLLPNPCATLGCTLPLRGAMHECLTPCWKQPTSQRSRIISTRLMLHDTLKRSWHSRRTQSLRIWSTFTFNPFRLSTQGVDSSSFHPIIFPSVLAIL